MYKKRTGTSDLPLFLACLFFGLTVIDLGWSIVALLDGRHAIAFLRMIPAMLIVYVGSRWAGDRL